MGARGRSGGHPRSPLAWPWLTRPTTASGACGLHEPREATDADCVSPPLLGWMLRSESVALAGLQTKPQQIGDLAEACCAQLPQPSLWPLRLGWSRLGCCSSSCGAWPRARLDGVEAVCRG